MAHIDWTTIRHFQPAEFDDPNHPGSWVHMAPETIRRLDDLRERTGWPIVTHNKFGLRGCVCVDHDGHAPNSYHYAPDASAVDFHFAYNADSREQGLALMAAGFRGIGFYYDWMWNGRPLAVGFHVDLRGRAQVWRRDGGRYTYLMK